MRRFPQIEKKRIVMTLNEVKAAIENNYKIVNAAIKVNEAKAAYIAAEKAHQAIEYDWSHKTSNDEWLARLEEYRKAEGNLKKAVNNFFKTVGVAPKKWDLGIKAIYAYNDYIDEHSGIYSTSPLEEISLYSLRCR